ncbi:transcriptional repressor [Candidatus Kaiserbacteria bacterium]|nr:MAG: transcriptional repressor [Candidatus Kaiserbacteria bacterium]
MNMQVGGNKIMVERILQGSGLKKTKGRVQVLGILINARNPMSIEEIECLVGTDIHFVTLYRMLRQFSKSGIVYQTDLRKGKVHYELQKKHHHHIVCTSCGIQEDVPMCMDDVQASIARQSKRFNVIDNHVLEFFGICKKCS